MENISKYFVEFERKKEISRFLFSNQGSIYGLENYSFGTNFCNELRVEKISKI
jgi:hypothetical protein